MCKRLGKEREQKYQTIATIVRTLAFNEVQ